MRTLILFGLLACPLIAQAQGAPATPAGISIEAGAQPVLDRATAALRDVQGLHFHTTTTFIHAGKTDVLQSDIDFRKLNRMRAVLVQGQSESRLISNGLVMAHFPPTSGQDAVAQNAPTLEQVWHEALLSRVSEYLSGMIEGNSPISTVQKLYGKTAEQGLTFNAVSVSKRVIGERTLSGVKLTYSYNHPQFGRREIEDALWFGPDNLLAEAQTKLSKDGKLFVQVDEVLTKFELNPTFAAGTFQIKIAPPKEEPPTFDPRLKVGAAPFPFTTKSLGGQVITPAKYKGKVLILDFWATWCGPCVAALPEVQAVYKKYHSQGLEVVSISLDDDKKAVQAFVKARQIPWPQLFDGKGWKNAIAAQYKVQAIPFMLVIGKNGLVTAVEPEGNLEAAVKTALAAR